MKLNESLSTFLSVAFGLRLALRAEERVQIVFRLHATLYRQVSSTLSADEILILGTLCYDTLAVEPRCGRYY